MSSHTRTHTFLHSMSYGPGPTGIPGMSCLCYTDMAISEGVEKDNAQDTRDTCCVGNTVIYHWTTGTARTSTIEYFFRLCATFKLRNVRNMHGLICDRLPRTPAECSALFTTGCVQVSVTHSTANTTHACITGMFFRYIYALS